MFRFSLLFSSVFLLVSVYLSVKITNQILKFLSILLLFPLLFALSLSFTIIILNPESTLGRFVSFNEALVFIEIKIYLYLHIMKTNTSSGKKVAYHPRIIGRFDYVKPSQCFLSSFRVSNTLGNSFFNISFCSGFTTFHFPVALTYFAFHPSSSNGFSPVDWFSIAIN